MDVRRGRSGSGQGGGIGPLVALAVLFSAAGGRGAEYFVAVGGCDGNPGTSVDRPFRTIGHAAGVLAAGDTCWIRAGVYREAVRLTRSGRTTEPVTFARYRGERVIVDGSDLVTGPWTRGDDGVWKAPAEGSGPVEALFCDGAMMVEARWPNCSWEENWEQDLKWARTGKGTQLGVIECPALAAVGRDLSGGLLYLKLGKGNNCFTRPVTGHAAGATRLEYDPTGIEGRAWNEDSMPERLRKHGFEANRFFVTARSGLDAPGEWWHDPDRGELSFLPPDADDPAAHEVSIKARAAGFEGEGLSDIVIEGLEFRCCSVRFEQCRRMVVRDCRFRFPSTPREFPDARTVAARRQNLRLAGDDNLLERVLVEWAIDGGIEVEGAGNRVEDCVVHDCNLHGRHPGPGISLLGRNRSDGTGGLPVNTITRCTVQNVGGVGVYAAGRGIVQADHNHVFNAGLYCVDVSAVYLPVGRDMAGSRIDHNWLHDVGGIGCRVDIQGRGIRFDHNLIWNVSVGCKLQGFELQAYNNTVLGSDSRAGFIVVFEPEASGEERAGWRVQNNVANAFHDRLSLRDDPRKASRPLLLPLRPEAGRIDHNAVVVKGEETRWFRDPAGVDFRPRPGGPLDSAGVTVAGVAEAVDGKSPAIGALEADGIPWRAGAGWRHDGLPVPASPAEATRLAERLRPRSLAIGGADRRYHQQ